MWNSNVQIMYTDDCYRGHAINYLQPPYTYDSHSVLFITHIHICTHTLALSSTEVPTYTVDLDQPPKLRWQKLVTDKKDDVSKSEPRMVAHTCPVVCLMCVFNNIIIMICTCRYEVYIVGITVYVYTCMMCTCTMCSRYG